MASIRVFPSSTLFTADGTAGGGIGILNPFMFKIGSKGTVVSATATALPVYVVDVDIIAGTVYVGNAAGAPIDVSAYHVADGARLLIEAAVAATVGVFMIVSPDSQSCDRWSSGHGWGRHRSCC